MNTWIQGKAEDHIPNNIALVLADPVYATDDVRFCWAAYCEYPLICFMYPKDLQRLPSPEPDQILHWVKPVSTKNTSKRYSQFVEAIAVRNLQFTEELHWSNRTGVFNDCLMGKQTHPWQKPESLIERLIRNHYNRAKGGVVFDPRAGSGTVHRVCKRLGIPSVSVEVDEKYGNPDEQT